MTCTRSGLRHLKFPFTLATLAALCAVFLMVNLASAHAAAVQENYSLLKWSGSWRSTTTTRAYGGAIRSSVATWASVAVGFEGSSLTWIGRRGPGQGRALIRVDDVYKATVNLATLGPKADRAVLYRVTGLKWGHHQVTLRAMGSTNASGTGSISVDAFTTDGRFSSVLRRATFGYPWNTYILVDKSSFRLHWVKDRWLVKSYPIAIGRQWGWTPVAVWKVLAKYKTDPLSVYGPRKMRLFRRVWTTSGYKYVYTAYGIHGTNEPWVIGTMASHGCIRLYNRDILELWPQVALGTMVVTRN